MTENFESDDHSSRNGAAVRGRAVWAGIDVGTQGVRVALLDESGRPVASGAAPLRSSRGPGRRHEQQPSAWWGATVAALGQACGAADARGIRALAICSTSGTVLLSDRDGRPLTPGVMYDDDRGTAHAAQVADTGRALWDELGLRIQGSWALPKLVELFAQARERGADPEQLRIVHSADHVAAQLAGAPTATDPSHALKSGYDALRGRWPLELMEQLGIPPQALPPVLAPGSPVAAAAAAPRSSPG
jgi:sugar (pentulose or hexulose) kinase